MPIEMTTTPAQIRKYLQEQIDRKRKQILRALQYVGESCLREARENHRYLNQTGNLCSSIGYCILENGRIITEGLWEQQAGGEKGTREGAKYLHSLAREAPQQGYVLIMVAGMPYAEYVEAMSLNVIDSAEQLAERMIPQLMKKLFR